MLWWGVAQVGLEGPVRSCPAPWGLIQLLVVLSVWLLALYPGRLSRMSACGQLWDSTRHEVELRTCHSLHLNPHTREQGDRVAATAVVALGPVAKLVWAVLAGTECPHQPGGSESEQEGSGMM